MALCFLLHAQSGGERGLQGKRETEGGVSRGCLVLEGLSETSPSGYSPTTRRLPSDSPGWSRTNPSSSPPSLLFSIYPLMPSFTPASPPPRAFRSTVPALPWSCSGKKEDKRKELKRQWGFLDDKADCSFLCLKFNCFLDMLDC